MLKHTRIQRYKSLVDVSVDLEPLTVFIGPNGSGKSSYCEALELFYAGVTHRKVAIDEQSDGKKNKVSISMKQLLQIRNLPNHAAVFSRGEYEGQSLSLNFDGVLGDSLS